MGEFRRVEAERAGPSALGILVPPGKRTFVILRPRSLPVDAVLCRSAEDLSFANLSHDEASVAAQRLYRLLREETVRVAVVAEQLRVELGEWVLLVCPRVPGQPYSPLLGEAAEATLPRLTAILEPASEQEVYFNTRFFER